MKLTYYFIIVVLSLSNNVYTQVSVGNKKPRGLLDVNDNTNGNATMGLVLPHTADVTAIEDPSSANEVSDISGTVAFDISNNCIKFIKNQGDWSECLAPSSRQSDGTMRAGTIRVGRGTYTPLRFETIDHDNTVRAFVVGLTKDKKVFVWGRATNIVDINNADPLVFGRRTPERIKNIPGDPLINKALKSGDGVIMLSQQAEVYVAGVNENNQFGSQFPTGAVIEPPERLILPSGETTAIDIASLSTTSSSGTIIIGGSGKAYFSGTAHYAPIRPGGATTGAFAADNIDQFTQIPFPQGVDEQSFKYTRVFADREVMLFLEGNDGNYYSSGVNIYGSLGHGSIVTTFFVRPNISQPVTRHIFVRVTDPPERVRFPRETRIKKFHFSFGSDDSRSAFAVAEDGNIFCMGYIGRGSQAKYIFAPIADSHIDKIKSVSTYTAGLVSVGMVADTYYTSIPLPLSKPSGVSNFVDMGIISHSIFALADNDSVYFHATSSTPGSYAVTRIDPDIEIQSVGNQNQWNWISNYLSTLNLGNLASMHSFNSGTAFALDKDGRAYYWGNAGANSNLAGTLTGADENYIVPTKLVDGRLDPDNKAPE